MEKKVALFDVDGVIIHSGMFSDHYAETRGISTDIMKPFFTGVFQDCLLGKADLKEVLIPWLDKWGYTEGSDAFLEEWFQYEEKVDAEVLNLVKKLKEEGIRCYLASNQEKYRIRYLLEEMKFKDLFDGTFTSSRIGFKKKSPQFFEYVLKELGVPGDEVIYFDDEEENVQAAKEVGIDAHLYTNIDLIKEKLPM